MGNDSLRHATAKVMDARMDRRQVFLRGAAAGLGASAFAATLNQAGFRASAQGDTSGLLTVSQDQVQSWIRNFNILIPGSTFLWPSTNGIHEPLMVANSINGDLVPWLATGYQYSDDGLTLTFRLRENVLWSDGQPFSSDDVAFTFNLIKGNDALSGSGAIRNILNLTTAIDTPDPNTVTFTFSKAYSPGLYDIVGNNIVPKHVWSTVADPVTFLNENPVGTGPFTEVPVFQSNYWELHKNPHYWQPDRVRIEGIRFPVLNNNDAAQKALISGEADWAANFIPDVEKVYVSQDPKHNTYWFPPTGDTVHLYLNTTVAPFDNADVRKAISMAINRQDIVSFAEYDYAVPADSTGLSGAYPSWKNMDYAGAAWVQQDVDAANALLDKVGLKKQGDTRVGPDGKPMEYDLLVVNGWTDWVQSCDIMSDNLSKIGIKAKTTPLDQTVWQEQRVGMGDFTMSIGWSTHGITPFNFYRGVMSSQTKVAIGTQAAENWHRFASPEADALLDQFSASNDPAELKSIADQLQKLYADLAPAIPLFPGPQWFEATTTRFEHWPSADKPYAIPSTYANERLLVFTTIGPVGSPELPPLRGAAAGTATPEAGTPGAGTPATEGSPVASPIA